MSTESDDIFTADSKVKALSRTAAATFLFRCKESILQAWESQCREKVLAAKLQSHPGLLNEIPKFIDQLILAISPDFKIDNEANSKVARDHDLLDRNLATPITILISTYMVLNAR